MNLADVFDLVGEVLPRKARRLLLVALLLMPGGAFVNWYVHEKTAGYQEMITEVVEGLFDHLIPTPDAPAARGPTAV